MSIFEHEVDDVWSNFMVGDRQLTWREKCDRLEADLRRHHRWGSLVADLDRCEHGRHEGDICSGCGGPSAGNTFLPSGTVLGCDIGGRPYIVPTRDQRHNPSNWQPATIGEPA